MTLYQPCDHVWFEENREHIYTSIVSSTTITRGSSNSSTPCRHKRFTSIHGFLALILCPALVVFAVTALNLLEDASLLSDIQKVIRFVHEEEQIHLFISNLQEERYTSFIYINKDIAILTEQDGSRLAEVYSHTDGSIRQLSTNAHPNIDDVKNKNNVLNNITALRLDIHMHRMNFLNNCLNSTGSNHDCRFYTDLIHNLTVELNSKSSLSYSHFPWKIQSRILKIQVRIELCSRETHAATMLGKDHTQSFLETVSPQSKAISYNPELHLLRLSMLNQIMSKQNKSHNKSTLTVKQRTLIDELKQYSQSLRKEQEQCYMELRATLKRDETYRTLTIGVTGVILCITTLLIIAQVMTLRNSLRTAKILKTAAVVTLREIASTREKVFSVMNHVLPKEVREEFNSTIEQKGRHDANMTVLTVELPNFSEILKQNSCHQVIDLMGSIFTLLDERVSLFDAYRIESPRNTYAVTSSLQGQTDHRNAQEIADLSLDFMVVTSDLEVPHSGKVNLKLVIHTGWGITAITGKEHLRYSVFGEVLQTAKLMLKKATPNRITMTEKTCQLLKKCGGYRIKLRGHIKLENGNRLSTMYLLGRDMILSGSDFDIEPSSMDISSISSRISTVNSKSGDLRNSKTSKTHSFIDQVKEIKTKISWPLNRSLRNSSESMLALQDIQDFETEQLGLTRKNSISKRRNTQLRKMSKAFKDGKT
ncbi:unnamed protein product, partial [Owenia fusiformis]